MTETTTHRPVNAHPAATVVLLRPGPSGLQALLTRRPATMAFASDMYVFPGGRVDAADADAGLAARSVRTAEEASVALGGDLDPTVAMAAHIAAIRELFEEAGVLLADVGGAAPDAILGGGALDAILGGGALAIDLAAARTAMLRGETDLPALATLLDLRLRTDLLVPLSRWVTPSDFRRRFDARFFAAQLPAGVEPTFEGDEVAGHVWLRPTDALADMAGGRLAMWLPTSATLQQLEHVGSLTQIAERLAPGLLGTATVETLTAEVTRIEMPAGGGVAGQPVNAYLVGRRRFVLVDPGDPTGPALDAAVDLAARRGGAIEAIALTHVDPDHAAGAEALAERFAIPVFCGPGGGRPLPYPVLELTDLTVLPAGDVALRAVATPGPRADHFAFVIGHASLLISGDLVGPRGARAVFGPPDDRAWQASRARLKDIAAEARWLPGHPAAADAVVVDSLA